MAKGRKKRNQKKGGNKKKQEGQSSSKPSSSPAAQAGKGSAASKNNSSNSNDGDCQPTTIEEFVKVNIARIPVATKKLFPGDPMIRFHTHLAKIEGEEAKRAEWRRYFRAVEKARESKNYDKTFHEMTNHQFSEVLPDDNIEVEELATIFQGDSRLCIAMAKAVKTCAGSDKQLASLFHSFVNQFENEGEKYKAAYAMASSLKSYYPDPNSTFDEFMEQYNTEKKKEQDEKSRTLEERAQAIEKLFTFRSVPKDEEEKFKIHTKAMAKGLAACMGHGGNEQEAIALMDKTYMNEMNKTFDVMDDDERALFSLMSPALIPRLLYEEEEPVDKFVDEELLPINGTKKVKTQATRDAKAGYRQAKEVAVTQQPVPVCSYCHQESEKIMKCSICLMTFYCSKECQRQAWPKHKKQECSFLKKERINKSTPDQPDTLSEDIVVPLIGIGLSPKLTGYSEGQEVLITIPAWDIERHDYRESICSKSPDEKKHLRASLLKSIKYFFKEERMPAGASITQEKIVNLCMDVLVLLWIHYPGVRETGPGFGADDFVLHFTALTPIPKGWKMDPTKMKHIHPSDVQLWERGIEQTRAEQGEDPSGEWKCNPLPRHL